MTAQIIIAGSGSFVPDTVITNEELVRFMGQKDAKWIEQRLGIKERRFMAPFDENGFPRWRTDELDMTEKAARGAMADAEIQAADIDGLHFISCTPVDNRQRLSRMAFDLHVRLGLQASARVTFADFGCGGVVHGIADIVELLRGGSRKAILIVASNAPSKFFGGRKEAYLNGDAWLPAYIFGDGAGAIVLKKCNSGQKGGIIGSFTAVDGTQPLMEYTVRAGNSTPVYSIDAHAVSIGYRKYTALALEGLRQLYPFDLGDVQRFYFHQANGHLLDQMVDSLRIPHDKVAKHVERYGNTSAAATLILFNEDRRAGTVMEGDLCVFCTIGAGTQYGALLVRV